MTSLLTNSSAMTALTTLKSISQQLDTTSNRVSTGQRVSSAADNAAYWSIATTVRTDNASLGAVKDALGLGSATVDTAYNGMNSIINDMQDLRTKLTSAMSSNVDRAKVQVEIEALKSKMKATADSSVMSGQNWLSVDSQSAKYNGGTQNIVAGFSRDGNGAIAFSNVVINVANTKLYDAGASSGTAAQITAGKAVGPTSDFSGTKQNVFTIAVNGGTAQTITLNSTAFATGVVPGSVTNQQLVDEINDQLKNGTGAINANGVLVTASLDTNGRLQFESAKVGSTASIVISNTATVPTTDIGFGVSATASVRGDGTTGAGGKGILDTIDVGGTGQSISSINISSVTDAQVNAFITQVDKAIAQMTNAATSLGASKKQIDGQKSFVDTLMKANDRTIGTLVDADIEEESTKLKALQTQQQLGVQALSIANSASQNVLSLFR